jgi:hypothetical protein
VTPGTRIVIRKAFDGHEGCFLVTSYTLTREADRTCLQFTATPANAEPAGDEPTFDIGTVGAHSGADLVVTSIQMHQWQTPETEEGRYLTSVSVLCKDVLSAQRDRERQDHYQQQVEESLRMMKMIKDNEEHEE